MEEMWRRKLKRTMRGFLEWFAMIADFEMNVAAGSYEEVVNNMGHYKGPAVSEDERRDCNQCGVLRRSAYFRFFFTRRGQRIRSMRGVTRPHEWDAQQTIRYRSEEHVILKLFYKKGAAVSEHERRKWGHE